MSFTLLFNPHSGHGRAETMATTLAKAMDIQTVLPVDAYQQQPNDKVILCGGDGSWHHLANQATTPIPTYLLPAGTMNLLARIVKNKADKAVIEEAWKRPPITMPAHQLTCANSTMLACMNWSFGLDATLMHHLESTRGKPLALRLMQALAASWQQDTPSHKVWADGQCLGEFQGGVFSLLPCYAHPALTLYKQPKWAWHGFLFQKQSCPSHCLRALRSIVQPLSLHQNITHTQAISIKVEDSPLLQADGEVYGPTTIEAKQVSSPLQLVCTKPIEI